MNDRYHENNCALNLVTLYFLKLSYLSHWNLSRGCVEFGLAGQHDVRTNVEWRQGWMYCTRGWPPCIKAAYANSRVTGISISLSFSRNCFARGSALWMNSAERGNVVTNISFAEDMSLSSFGAGLRPRKTQGRLFRLLRAGQPGPQGSLQLPMAPLYYAIALLLVGRGVDELDS